MCLQPGDIIGEQYELISQLGSGGFAKTYLAKDIKQSNSYLRVVKEIIPKTDSNLALQKVKNRFKREINAIKKLGKHPQIPSFFRAFQENNKFYLVQEYIEGHDLTQEIILGKPLSSSEVIQLLTEVLEILKFVHQHEVIHRDIKPSNLMRRESDGKIILIDFGAVKQLSSLEDVRTIAIGTSGYMAPEQRHGTPKRNSDIYALGMTAIQALTGLHPQNLHPYQETGEIEWRSWVSVSSNLADVLDKMICYNFKERYQSATEVLADLPKTSALNQAIATNTLHHLARKINPILVYISGFSLVCLTGLFILLTKARPKTCPVTLADDLSCGEEILVREESLHQCHSSRFRM